MRSPADSPTGQARQFLDAYLGHGSRPVSAIYAAGARNGHDAPTLRAAARELGVRTVPGPLVTGHDGRPAASAKWALPPAKTSRSRPTPPRRAARVGRRLPCGCCECPAHAGIVI